MTDQKIDPAGGSPVHVPTRGTLPARIGGNVKSLPEFGPSVMDASVYRDQVLAVGNGADLKVGTPLVSGATVTVTVLAHGKHDKVHIFKMRRRKHYQKRQGHRQQYTELQIGAIAG